MALRRVPSRELFLVAQRSVRLVGVPGRAGELGGRGSRRPHGRFPA
jgi:hypothetical protein